MKIKYFTTIVMMLVFIISSNSQVSIFYTDLAGNPLNNIDIVPCSDNNSQVNQIRLVFTDDGANNAKITISFPIGVQYRLGTVSTIAQIGGLTVSEFDVSDLTKPVFSIPPTDLSSGNSITIEWAREAL